MVAHTTAEQVRPVVLGVAVDSFQVRQPTEQVVKATLAATEATSGAVVRQQAAEVALVVREPSETRLTATAVPVCLIQSPARRVGMRLAVAVVVGVWGPISKMVVQELAVVVQVVAAQTHRCRELQTPVAVAAVRLLVAKHTDPQVDREL